MIDRGGEQRDSARLRRVDSEVNLIPDFTPDNSLVEEELKHLESEDGSVRFSVQSSIR